MVTRDLLNNYFNQADIIIILCGVSKRKHFRQLLSNNNVTSSVSKPTYFQSSQHNKLSFRILPPGKIFLQHAMEINVTKHKLAKQANHSNYNH